MDRLADRLAVLNPAVDFSPLGGNVRLQDDGSGPYIASWDEAALGPQPTEAALQAVVLPSEEEAVLIRLRQQAKILIESAIESSAKVDRAIIVLLVKELNILRKWITDFKGKVAISSTLADYKIKVAELDSLPDRMKLQVINNIKNEIDLDA